MPVVFTKYRVKIKCDTRIIGGVPILSETATPDEKEKTYEKWIAKQGGDSAEIVGTPVSAILAEDPEMPLTETEEKPTGFKRNTDGHVYIETRQVKAMLKETAQRLGYIKDTRGTRQVLQHDLHVRALDGTSRIVLAEAPDGIETQPISVITPQGPRAALVQYEYVNEPTLEFDVLILSGGVGDGLIDGEKLANMIELGGWVGLGARRSQGEGTFTVLDINKIDN